MKLVTAIIKPFKLDEVREALSRDRRAGHHRHRGQGLRPPEGPHRALPRRRVRRRLPAQGEDRGRGRRRRSSTACIEAIEGAARTGKIGDGKIFVSDARAGRAHPHRRNRRGRALTSAHSTENNTMKKLLASLALGFGVLAAAAPASAQAAGAPAAAAAGGHGAGRRRAGAGRRCRRPPQRPPRRLPRLPPPPRRSPNKGDTAWMIVCHRCS